MKTAIDLITSLRCLVDKNLNIDVHQRRKAKKQHDTGGCRCYVTKPYEGVAGRYILEISDRDGNTTITKKLIKK